MSKKTLTPKRGKDKLMAMLSRGYKTDELNKMIAECSPTEWQDRIRYRKMVAEVLNMDLNKYNHVTDRRDD